MDQQHPPNNGHQPAPPGRSDQPAGRPWQADPPPGSQVPPGIPDFAAPSPPEPQVSGSGTPTGQPTAARAVSPHDHAARQPAPPPAGQWQPVPGSRAPVGTPPGAPRNPLPLVIAAVVGLALIVLVAIWMLNRADQGGSGPAPAPQPTQTAQQPTSGPTTRGPDSRDPAIPHQQSTRSPGWEPTRNEPRIGVAPFVALGEPAEFFDGDSIGLVTVLDYEWLEDTRREPSPGRSFLAVEMEFEAVLGAVTYSPVRAEISDPDQGRYGFMYNSSLTDYPQFDVSDLAPGQVMRGWVLFETPRSNVTLSYSSYTEEALRLSIEGGGDYLPEPPPIELSGTFQDDTTRRGSGTIEVEGAAWFERTEGRPPDPGNMFLGVKVRITAGPDNPYQPSVGNQFTVVDGSGIEYEPDFAGSTDYWPELDLRELQATDQVSGWLYFELPAQEVTLVVSGRSLEPIGEVTVPA